MNRPAAQGGPDVRTIADLVAALRTRIPHTRTGTGRELIIEVRDGLEDAAAAYRSTGLPAAVAERRAVEDFGIEEVDLIAEQCRTELGVSATTRAAAVVGVGYALILGCWSLYYAIFGSVTRFTNGTAAGNGFTIIGAITAFSALVTVGFLRYRRRRANPTQPITIGFAVLTAVSLFVTYLLALLSHRSPDVPPAGLVAGLIVEGLSLAITVVMAWSVLYSVLRTANASRREGTRDAAGRNSEATFR